MGAQENRQPALSGEAFLIMVLIGNSNHMLLASGLLVQVFNLKWYCLPFKWYLVVNMWTSMLFLIVMKPNFCMKWDAREQTPAFLHALDIIFSMVFDSPPFCAGSTCFMQSTSLCHRLFMVWHGCVYGFFFPAFAWLSEWNSRVHFLEYIHNENQPNNGHIQFVGQVIQWRSLLPRLFYVLPLVWQMIALIK